MTRSRAASRRGQPLHPKNESGFTLIEVLLGSALFVLVLVPIMGSLIFAQNQTPKTVEYAKAISSATSGLQQMMREIRQAYRINGTNGGDNGVGSWIDFFAVINDVDVEIKYECDEPSVTVSGDYSCRRVSAPTGTTLPDPSTGAVVIDRVTTSNGNVFTFLGRNGTPDSVNLTYVQANVHVPAAAALQHTLTHTITLDNATAIPNLQNG